RSTADLARDALPAGVELFGLGVHRLRDLARADDIFQLTHPALPGDFPPLRTLEAFPGNLPTQRTELIRRARELARLAELAATHRLVTLTGVGGVGKTRLVLQLAGTVLEKFPDGAWFVALASVRDAELVPGEVAAVLQVPDRPGRSIVDCLCD